MIPAVLDIYHDEPPDTPGSESEMANAPEKKERKTDHTSEPPSFV